VPVEVHVVTPEREVWSGSAEMLIARGVDGELGILGGHAPMMVQLAIGPLRIHPEGDASDEVRAVVDGGFMHVTSEGGETRVDVLANGAALEDEIDVEAARRRLEELGTASDAEDETLQTEVAKAEARINLAG
jgi:F-type H+-transporting ATPase subunit epsilon